MPEGSALTNEPPDESGRRWPVPSETAIRVMIVLAVLVVLVGAMLVGARVYVLSQHDEEQSRQIRNLERIAPSTKTAGLIRCQTSLRRDSHGGATPN